MLGGNGALRVLLAVTVEVPQMQALAVQQGAGYELEVLGFNLPGREMDEFELSFNRLGRLCAFSEQATETGFQRANVFVQQAGLDALHQMKHRQQSKDLR